MELCYNPGHQSRVVYHHSAPNLNWQQLPQSLPYHYRQLHLSELKGLTPYPDERIVFKEKRNHG